MLTINPAFAPGRTRRARRRRLAKLTATGLPTGVTARFDPTGQVSQLAYDSKGQLSAMTLTAQVSTNAVPIINAGTSIPTTIPVASRKVTLGYNTADDVNLFTDALGQETRLSTDALGRQTGATDPLGYSSAQQYNQLDQPTVATNALQQTSGQSYDSAGRLSSVTNPAGIAIESYTYDSQGRLTRTIDPLSQTTNIEYDT